MPLGREREGYLPGVARTTTSGARRAWKKPFVARSHPPIFLPGVLFHIFVGSQPVKICKIVELCVEGLRAPKRSARLSDLFFTFHSICKE